MPDISRRTLLNAGALTVGATALAACGSSSDGGSSSSATAPVESGSTSDTPAPSDSPSPSDSASPSDSGEPSSSGAGAVAGLVALADVPVGGAVSATGADGDPLLVSQPTKGKVMAFSAICTHQGCTVAPGDGTLNCPCHGSVYDMATGAVISGPAPDPLSEVAVTVQDGEVVEA